MIEQNRTPHEEFQINDAVVFDIEGSGQSGTGHITRLLPGGGIQMQPDLPIFANQRIINIRKSA